MSELKERLLEEIHSIGLDFNSWGTEAKSELIDKVHLFYESKFNEVAEMARLVKLGKERGYKNPEQWADHLLKGRSKMKIEVGKYYKTRDGRKVGPMEADTPSTLSVKLNGKWKSFRIKSGTNLFDSNLDLICEWHDTEHVSAANILNKASEHMKERASTYDNPQGERSMSKTVEIFNLHHGTNLTAAQGWHFMQVLKDVRLFSRDQYHADSAEDCVAYAALKAEALNAR